MTPTPLRLRAGARAGVLGGLLLMLLGPPSAAADDDAKLRAALVQRLRLTASLMADSGAAQRIAASGNLRAAAHLDEGRVHHALAQDRLARGDLAGAREAVDDALRHFGQARRLVPDSQGLQAAARARHAQMRASLERLVDAWQARLRAGDAAGSAGDVGMADGDLVAAVGLIETARAFADRGRFDDAVHTLSLAEGHVLTGMNRVMHARTLDYTARAGTPAEAFQLEAARYSSLADLVPLAVRDLKPTPEALALVERYAQAGTQLRDRAQQQLADGHTQQALVDLGHALMFVQRALASAGLVAPPAAGATP